MKNKLDIHYENISNLYLRLKGYIVTNLIIHSEIQGNSKSELDILGIRMPFHLQENRKVSVFDYLESSKESIEIIIADVKNVNNINKVKFNDGLRKHDSSIQQLIDWIGISNQEKDLLNKFKSSLNLHKSTELNGYETFDENLSIGKFSFKFTFFCPSLPEWNGKGFKYIHGDEIIEFIWECLNTINKIDTCSRKYNFENWNEFQEYVCFFKNTNTKITLKEFEEHFKNIKPKHYS